MVDCLQVRLFFVIVKRDSCSEARWVLLLLLFPSFWRILLMRMSVLCAGLTKLAWSLGWGAQNSRELVNFSSNWVDHSRTLRLI